MKTILLLTSALLLICGFTWKKVPAKDIVIGRYRYNISLEKGYDHDDNAHSIYFVVKRAKSRIELCSSTLLKTRNGTTLTTGEYYIDGSRLLFKERYFGPKRIRGFAFADSVEKTFHSDSRGQLHLIEIKQYKGREINSLRY
jgi:hypothetical protein